ncbi:nodulation protein NfeD [Belliella kenyensis]|uniref:Nodulation protein NfeD n=1 Tax=Belliella kenyensis TaxID=1472724 RepID=A0ABV8EM00_9BACT|nr:NfeD family protein [Belliella kenyensis]MCH7403574.1 nodulation protein NfeD [Belliella kenyensis]MDN3603874.1 NfeD family protein [Belliella kenyensis]
MRTFLFILLSFITASVSTYGLQDEHTLERKKVYTFEIKNDIDPRMNRKVRLALEEAKAKDVEMIIIEMDTYGGAVNDADDIRTMILETKTPIHVWINKDAASAGALISIACDSIYMAPGASIGAATVVMGGGGEAAPDKYQSYMRSMMRSTAEAKGRNPKIAEAMVDQNLEIEGITEKGSVITFSTSEAQANGFSEGQANSIDEVIKKQGLDQYELISYKESNVELIISFFLNPAVSGFLILIIFAGIYFEIQTPGVGFPLAASILAITLYFIPYYLTGLASNFELAIFILGIILLAVELFVIPGFGIFGVLGIVGILAGLTLGMLPNDAFDFTFVPSDDLFIALLTVILSSTIAIGLIFYFAPKVNQWKAFSAVTLANTQKRTEGYTSSNYNDDLLGKTGITQTRLMPSGKIIIADEVYDAYSRGEFIDKGEPIIVISTEGTSLKVKRYIQA